MDLRRLRHIQDMLAGMMTHRQKRRLPILPAGDTEQEQVTSLLEYLNGNSAKSIPSAWQIGDVLIFSAIPLTVATIFLILAITERIGIHTIIPICYIFSFVAMISVARLFPGYRAALHQLTGYDDPRVVSPLLRSLNFPDRKVRDAARIALTRHLKHLTPERIGELPTGDYKRVCKQLTLENATQYPEFAESIFRVLILRGDLPARAALERFVRKPFASVKGRVFQVRAREYLAEMGTERARVYALLSRYDTLQGNRAGFAALPLFPVPFIMTFAFHLIRSEPVTLFPMFGSLVLAPPFALAAILLLLMGMAGCFYTYNRLGRQRQALLATAQITSPEALGPFLEGYSQIQERSLGQNQLDPLLIDLLYHQTDVANLSAAKLTTSQQDILFKLVTTSKNRALVRACLHIIGLLGTGRTLLPLARLVVRDAPESEARQIRDEAGETLKRISESLDYGTVEDIPRWVAEMPTSITSNTTTLQEEYPNALQAYYALTHLLPQLTPADSRLLPASARRKLHNAQNLLLWLLSDGTEIGSVSRLGIRFRLATLDALATVGDGEDLKYVEGFAHMEADTEDLQKVRMRARQVLPLLKARIAEFKISGVLLRGSSAPPPSNDQLLRASSAQSHTEPANELLRPTETSPTPVEILSGVSKIESKQAEAGTSAPASEVLSVENPLSSSSSRSAYATGEAEIQQIVSRSQ